MKRRLQITCIVVVAMCHENICPAKLPLIVGEYQQEVALHRERQTGLPSSNVLTVRSETDDEVLVQTTVGWSKWNGRCWIDCKPGTAKPQSLSDVGEVNQVAHSFDEKKTAVASSAGLYESIQPGDWKKLIISDGLGRLWADSDVRGATYDSQGRLWFASLAGVGCRHKDGRWQFFEGKDGLPYNYFTCAAAGDDGSVWFGTTRGAIRFHNETWSYRQGLRWLPDDDVRAIHVEQDGTVWLATAGGVGCIAMESMTLERKAAIYEDEIDQHLKRTEFGYVNTGRLAASGDKSQVTLSDSDNDGLWTAMYGASQCFAHAVTKTDISRKRAEQAFEALRFLQVVTQAAEHSPPHGYVARSVLPTTGRDPNLGRLERDEQFRRTRDKMWKVYEPRWPKSKDGKWYWKSDTSSDELDGHYFFYPLYLDLVADSEQEKTRVRKVVRDLTDHLIRYDFVLQEHDGTPTRWGVFRPSSLNRDLRWYQERGLNSLSMLSYLAVAHYVTGNDHYEEVSRKLREEHHYDINLLVPKMQRGIGTGNQSDDEMAFMSFYNLVKYTRDPALRKQYLSAFYASWMLEQPERNPFFHFAYAAMGRGESTAGTFGDRDLSPWGDWLEDSVATLKGFPLDRMNWAHVNSHRLDLRSLPKQQSGDYLGTNPSGRRPTRGYRVDGKVLPVDERFFDHWNTDPWRLDYGGDGRSLACGSVFLLPYYMGRYHGLID
jgi:hypothetical protein